LESNKNGVGFNLIPFFASNPEIRTLVSTTIRTLAFRACGFHFGVDLIHRHRRNTGGDGAVGNRQQRSPHPRCGGRRCGRGPPTFSPLPE
jgi:hypothetical protein